MSCGLCKESSEELDDIGLCPCCRHVIDLKAACPRRWTIGFKCELPHAIPVTPQALPVTILKIADFLIESTASKQPRLLRDRLRRFMSDPMHTDTGHVQSLAYQVTIKGSQEWRKMPDKMKTQALLTEVMPMQMTLRALPIRLLVDEPNRFMLLCFFLSRPSPRQSPAGGV